MKLSSIKSGGTLTVTITGELDVTSIAAVRAGLDSLVDQATDGLTMDISGLRLIDSSGVGVLVYLYRRLRDAGRSFTIRGANQQPLSILRLMKLDRVFMSAKDA